MCIVYLSSCKWWKEGFCNDCGISGHENMHFNMRIIDACILKVIEEVKLWCD